MPTRPRSAAPGPNAEPPRWKGPAENLPTGSPTVGPDLDHGGAGDSLADGEKSHPSDSFTVQPAAEDREDRIRRRAYDLWEREGRPEGEHERHWHQAARDVDELIPPD